MNPNEDVADWCYTTDARHKTEYCPSPPSFGKLLVLARKFLCGLKELINLQNISLYTC